MLVFSLPSARSQEKKKDCNCPGSEKKHKGSFYFAWGYNRETYSKSTIRFKSSANDFDFTLHSLVAHDKPDYWDIPSINISVPQYNYRLGYYFNDAKDQGIEINFDHAKYVVSEQMAHITGHIHEQVMNKDTMLLDQNFHFEHTDGANFLLINYMKRFKLLEKKNQHLYFVVKAGAGVGIPRTDVTLFGKRLNNNFHIAGEIAGADVTLRYEFLKHGFFELSGKGIYANYSNVLAHCPLVSDSQASHRFGTLEAILTTGYRF
jgi:hypothetical protein